jgi:excisionase family DNA binding protein
MEKVLTVNEVAQILSLKPITVREMFREGRLRGFKMGKAWRTTESILEQDIVAMATRAMDDSETASTPGGEQAMPKANDAPKQPKKPRKTEGEEQSPVHRQTDYPEATPTDPEDTSSPKWTAPAGKADGHPDIAVDSQDDAGTPLSVPRKLMSSQEQISGTRQRETQIPPEDEREPDVSKSTKRKKRGSDEDQLGFEDIE